MRTGFLVGVALAATTGPVGAAMLRPLTQLNGPVVLLSDLFDDAGPQASRPLGPGPAPGESITVGAPQLAAIARQFGVAWRPASSVDRAVLRRPGVPLSREVLATALRTALDAAGAGQGDLDLPDFSPPMVGLDAHPRADVEQLDYDAAGGRFSATLGVTGTGMDPLQLRITGRLDATEAVLVASHRLDAGVPIVPGDLHPARVRNALLRGPVLRAVDQATGLAPRHAVAPGQPILLTELEKPAMVRRGAKVAITLDMPGLSLASAGEALEEGAAGDRISVLNPTSHAVVLAEVTGPDAVRLEPNSLPIRAGSDAGARGAATARLAP